jgi:hypothetical protein
MTSRPIRIIALFLGFAVPLQLVIPAGAQETVTVSSPQAANSAPAADDPAATAQPVNDQAANDQNAQIDAPSATLKRQQDGQQISTDKASPAELAQTIEVSPIQQEPRAVPKKDEGAKDQNPSQNPAQQPEGAAAAQVQPTTGTAGSKPAGAALAPPKQRRIRSLLIRLGAVAGAGIALGTVYALSTASPSKPPGSH